jgi:hypothetical protein
MSINWVDYDSYDGEIIFGLHSPANENSEQRYISIRYKGILDIERNRFMADPNMTDEPVMYDIKYTKKEGINSNNSTYTEEFFRVLDTNIIIRIVKESLLLDIHSNGLDLGLTIKDEAMYNEIIDTFNKAITEIQNKRLNTVNAPNFPLPNNMKGLIGSFLTGHNGTIAQQRLKIGRNGGRRKTRKTRKACMK